MGNINTNKLKLVHTKLLFNHLNFLLPPHFFGKLYIFILKLVPIDLCYKIHKLGNLTIAVSIIFLFKELFDLNKFFRSQTFFSFQKMVEIVVDGGLVLVLKLLLVGAIFTGNILYSKVGAL